MSGPHRKLVVQLTLFAFGFLVFGFALAPLYETICDITGYGSRKTLSQAATPLTASTAIRREITVEYISSVPTIGEWEFRPLTVSAKVRTGQLSEAKFIARNLSTQPATAQAIPDVAPHFASRYFRKTECFCFTPQFFEAGQERELIVRFVVDPDLPDEVDRITLGYAMYRAPQTVAAR